MKQNETTNLFKRRTNTVHLRTQTTGSDTGRTEVEVFQTHRLRSLYVSEENRHYEEGRGDQMGCRQTIAYNAI